MCRRAGAKPVAEAGKGDAITGRDAEFQRWLRTVVANLQQAVRTRPMLTVPNDSQMTPAA